jgi:hypothetical protein
MADDEIMSPEQWVAARMFVAVLGAEANEESGDDVDFEEIGVEVLPVEEIMFAMTAQHQILTGDMMYAAKMLLWSLVCSFAELAGITPAQAVSHLGMNLALCEPGT